MACATSLPGSRTGVAACRAQRRPSTVGRNVQYRALWTPLYFSITTFTTLGYGDFAPTGWLRAVAGTQALLGVAIIALFTVAWGRKMIR